MKFSWWRVSRMHGASGRPTQDTPCSSLLLVATDAPGDLGTVRWVWRLVPGWLCGVEPAVPLVLAMFQASVRGMLQRVSYMPMLV